MFLKHYARSRNHTGYGNHFWRWLLLDYIRHASSYLNLCFEIKQERNDLAKLPDSVLRDIGIHPADAAAERRRSFYDVPDSRRNLYHESDNQENQS